MTRIEAPNSTLPLSRGRGKRFALILLLVAVGSIAAWTWATLSWSYSDGVRAGVVQKFSRRGLLCKTDEGELAMYIVAGIAPQIWNFTVRDGAVADQISKAVGRRVQLHYTEHPAVPTSCLGDTRYFVDRITIVDNGASATP